MLNEKMKALGQNRSKIRDLFEYGKILKQQGETVCDFTLGNPSVKTPDSVTQILIDGLKKSDVHAYTQAQGSAMARQKIASDLNKKGKTTFTENGIALTCGAAASLCGVFKAITSSRTDEIVVLSPFFPEYKVFIESCSSNFKSVEFDNDFSPSFSSLENAITKNTKALVINNPNNPSGKIYTVDEICKITEILNKKSKEFSHPIYLISDEPYREIVFGDAKLPFIPDFYKDTIICYSFSKSLSLPGERIGYIAIPSEISEFIDLYASILGSLRAFGYVCAPSLFQYLIENFNGEYSDFSIYENNLKTLLSTLKNLGFTCNEPKGAFYLMVKAPDGDSEKMSERAKELGLLIVPADSFGAKGWVRIATCVSKETVENSKPLFEKLAKVYNLI
ncbi:MAG: pyridoxal phosphate-dependent aminotransferase [Clostridia bacterium]|nr:pyridoxal phosphate-dependent aminotransferase [Clostridia bacterium]